MEDQCLMTSRAVYVSPTPGDATRRGQEETVAQAQQEAFAGAVRSQYHSARSSLCLKGDAIKQALPTHLKADLVQYEGQNRRLDLNAGAPKASEHTGQQAESPVP